MLLHVAETLGGIALVQCVRKGAPGICGSVGSITNLHTMDHVGGANYIHDIAGLMNADLTVSYEKLVVDNEILGMCQRVLRGIEVNEETLAADLIIGNGPGSSFMAEEHTVRHMRSEFYVPGLSVRKKREPAQTMDVTAVTNAREMVRRILCEETEDRMDSAVRDRLLDRFPEIVDPKSRETAKAAL